MAQHRRSIPNKRQASRLPSPTRSLARAPEVIERRPPVVYGKPFILMEDADKQTFIYLAGSWVPHSLSIAECRQTCLVKALPQSVGKMTRYEVRSPSNA